MSTDTHAQGGHGDAPAHSTRSGYMTGFLLSVILTAVPFWLVMTHTITNPGTTALVIAGIALVQVIVHMIYFLHMSSKSEGGWSMMAMIFTIIVVGIGLGGSMWVMYHMNLQMMPGMTDAASSGV